MIMTRPSTMLRLSALAAATALLAGAALAQTTATTPKTGENRWIKNPMGVGLIVKVGPVTGNTASISWCAEGGGGGSATQPTSSLLTLAEAKAAALTAANEKCSGVTIAGATTTGTAPAATTTPAAAPSTTTTTTTTTTMPPPKPATPTPAPTTATPAPTTTTTTTTTMPAPTTTTPPKVVAAPAPTTTTTTTTTGSTGQPVVTPKLYCDDARVKLTASKLSAADREKILKMHNDERAKYGNAALTWDDTVAQFSQGWSDAVALANKEGKKGDWASWPHSRDSCFATKSNATSYGENIGGGNDVASSVQSWLNEKTFYSIPTRNCTSGECRHYLALVSKLTTKIGCGYNVESGLICNYTPIGVMRSPAGGFVEVMTKP